MSDIPNQKFKITVPITGYKLHKNADGTEKYVITGMASNTDLDLTGEQMAETAIASMAKSLETHAVIFKSEHHDDWDAEFGEVTALYATPEHQLMMEAELDPDHYRTKTLVKALDRGKKLGLSIGGLVVDSAYEWMTDIGRKVKSYKDILLEEISVTGSPAVASTWLDNITKSVKDWKETPMPKTEDVINTEEVTPTDAPVETPEETPADPPAEQPTEMPAEENTPEASTLDTPESEAAKGDEPTETPEDSPATDTPADPKAPEQTDEPAKPDGAEAAESTPVPAADDTSDVAKSAILGSYAEADVVYGSIDSLTWNLKWFIWDVIADSDKTQEDKDALVAAALAEFTKIIQTLASALIESGISDEAAKSAAQQRADSPEALSKSLIEKDAKVQELTKSLTEATAELETTKTSLQEKESELEKINARKGIVFDKFSGKEEAKPDVQEVTRAAQTKFAGFITGGPR